MQAYHGSTDLQFDVMIHLDELRTHLKRDLGFVGYKSVTFNDPLFKAKLKAVFKANLNYAVKHALIRGQL